MENDSKNIRVVQSMEELTRMMIRSHINSFSQDGKFLMGLLPYVPRIPDDKQHYDEMISQHAHSLASRLNSIDIVREIAVKELHGLGIDEPQEDSTRMLQKRLEEALKALSEEKILSAGVFGTLITAELVEERMQFHEDGIYEDILEKRVQISQL